MEFGYLSYRVSNLLLGINKKRNLQTFFVDRKKSGCEQCRDKNCGGCSHRYLKTKIIPLVAHGKMSYVPKNRSFRESGNVSEFLVYLCLLMSKPTENGLVHHVEAEKLATMIGVSDRTIHRALRSLADKRLISFEAISPYNYSTYFFEIKLLNYADTFRKVNKDGGGYVRLNDRFVATVLDEMRRDRDINKLRLLIRCAQISTLYSIDGNHRLSKAGIASILPDYAKGKQLRELIDYVFGLGFLKKDEDEKGKYYIVTLPGSFDAGETYQNIYSQCSEKLRELFRRKGNKGFIADCFFQNETFCDDLVRTFTRDGSRGILQIPVVYSEVARNYLSHKNIAEWKKDSSKLIHLFSTILFNLVYDGPPSHAPFQLFFSYIQEHQNKEPEAIPS